MSVLYESGTILLYSTFHSFNVFKTAGCVILSVIGSTNLPIESSVFTA